jgi:hypothetical protein
MTIYYSRVGPVYLWWSESDDAATIGPKDGAWGGDDIYKCDVHPDWQGDGKDEFHEHAAEHGYYLAPQTTYA